MIGSFPWMVETVFASCVHVRGSGREQVHSGDTAGGRGEYKEMEQSILGDGDMKGAAGDVLLPPFDDEDVVALLLDRVGDVVHPVAHVFDVDLFTGGLWTMDPHHQHVSACFAAVYSEGVLLAHEGLGQAGAPGDHLTPIGGELGHGAVGRARRRRLGDRLHEHGRGFV